MTSDHDPLQVIFLTGEFPPMQGGIADYTAHLATHLQDQQIRPAVLISRVYRQTRPDYRNQVPVYPHLSGWGVRCWPQTERFLHAHRPQILHIQYQAAAFDLGGWVNWLPWFMRRRTARPAIVTTFHDLRIPYLFPKAGGLRWQSVLGLARYSDAVICTNREDALILRDQPWGRHVHEIPLGNNVAVAPPPDFDRRTWRAGLGLDDRALVLAYFGFLNESKGGEDLIATLADLVRRGCDAYLLMVGGDVGDSDPTNRAYAERVRHRIAEYKLSERIIFTGYVSLAEVSAHLLAADLALMPYLDGVSFRRTTLIALLRHGLPVISTTPAIDLPRIRAGENMLLVPPGEIALFAETILQVAGDAALRQRLAQGAQRLADQFDWAEIAAATAALYRSLRPGYD